MARSNDEIAADLRTAASWHEGAQATFLASLASELDGSAPPTPSPNEHVEAATAAANAAGTDADAAAAEAARLHGVLPTSQDPATLTAADPFQQ